jgi:hypothetical protein
MDFETATCRCNACGQPHGQDQWQSEPGQWIAENPGVTLDLMVMCLCILEMFRGTLDTMQPVIADRTPKDTAPIQFGAQKVIVNDPVLANAFGVLRRSNHNPPGFGAALGSGIQW